MTEELIRNAEKALQARDPVLSQLIREQKLMPRRPRSDYFSSLCNSIVSQQVSVAAADAIYARLKAKTNLSPHVAVDLSNEDAKSIGLSRQKAAYIKDLAAHFVEDPEIYSHLERQSDDQVVTELTAVKGIGVWTAQMFLMFTLVRPDVFAPDDVGLQRAMLKLYKWEKLPSKQGLIAVAEHWRPYRTVACLHLWQSLDNTPD